MVWRVAIFAMLAGSGLATAEELQSGIPPGEVVSPLEAVKCGGAKNDGVKLGERLCYVCKYDVRPVVAVFARGSSKPLGEFIKQIDMAVAKHEKEKLAAFVAIIGDRSRRLQLHAKALAVKYKIQNLPLVVPVENAEKGPPDFLLSDKAQVTVMLYVEGEVKARHAFAPGKLDAAGAQRVLKDLQKILPK